MIEKTFWLKRPGNVSVYVKKWDSSGSSPRFIVQLAHGMVEHIDRYQEFASFLAENDIVVYGNDHRGHGKTGEEQGIMGFFANKNGFEKVSQDFLAVTRLIKQNYPDTPLILMGHSMGSFLVRHYIQQYSHLPDGVILSGTGYYSRATSETAARIAAALPAKEKSGFMNSLAFSSYNRHISNKKTNFDWLTRDETIIQAFMDDPYCGFIPTAGFFYDLMEGVSLIHDKKRNSQIRSDLPMLIVSGTDDPVGDYTKGIWQTANLYHKAGLTHIKTMLFENGRHELLNEINRHEVYQILLAWITDLTVDNS